MKKFSAPFAKSLAADIQGDDLQGKLPTGYASRLIYILGFASKPEALLKNLLTQNTSEGWLSAVGNDADGLNMHIAVHRYAEVMDKHLANVADTPEPATAAPAQPDPLTRWRENPSATTFRDWVQDQEDKAMAARAADREGDDRMVKGLLDKLLGEDNSLINALFSNGMEPIGIDSPDVGVETDKFLDMLSKMPGVKVIRVQPGADGLRDALGKLAGDKG